jgi:hypothetical protein
MTTVVQLRAAITAAVALAGSITAKAVVWDKAGHVIADPIVRLSITSDISETSDPRTVRETSPSGDLTIALSTSRVASIQLRTETSAAATPTDAQVLSVGIELGLSLASVTALLQSAGVALVRVHPHTDLSFSSGDCLIYARTFDADFRYAYDRADPIAQGIIEHVKVSGELANPDITVPSSTIDKPVEST